MKAMDCRMMAEEWVEHIVGQYSVTHVCRKDLSLIQYLLQKGYTLIAVRDETKVLHVDFLTQKQKPQHKKRERDGKVKSQKPCSWRWSHL